MRKIANLFATVTLYSDSPTLLDRFANALSKEAAIKVLYDAQRILQVGLKNNEVREDKEKGQDGKEYPVIRIQYKKGNEVYNYKVNGFLPLDSEVQQFISYLEKDIYYARRAGALAMSSANQALILG